jgi:hypothetical protein
MKRYLPPALVYTCFKKEYNFSVVAEWLRHYAISQKDTGLRVDEVNDFFNLPNPSGCSQPWGLVRL